MTSKFSLWMILLAFSFPLKGVDTGQIQIRLTKSDFSTEQINSTFKIARLFTANQTFESVDCQQLERGNLFFQINGKPEVLKLNCSTFSNVLKALNKGRSPASYKPIEIIISGP
jgi:uncharacterized protein Smg (DUF494 family)